MQGNRSFFSWILGQSWIAVFALLCFASCRATEPANRILVAGQVGHVGSGVLFPEKLGAFQRGEFVESDEAGLDVHAPYTRFHLRDRLNATLYVFPGAPLRSMGSSKEQIRNARKSMLAMSFEGVKEEVLAHNVGATLVREDDMVVRLFDQERDARVANFTFVEHLGSMEIEFLSTATLISLDQWLVMIRLTAPTDSIRRSEVEVRGFLQAFLNANEGSYVSAGVKD